MEQTVKFKDGTTLRTITCRGGKEMFRDAYRDVLSFILRPADISLDGADALFSAENCEELLISDGEHEYLHEGYTERVSLMKSAYLLGEQGEVLICVKMAVKSEAERRMAELEAANNILLGLEG